MAWESRVRHRDLRFHGRGAATVGVGVLGLANSAILVLDLQERLHVLDGLLELSNPLVLLLDRLLARRHFFFQRADALLRTTGPAKTRPSTASAPSAEPDLALAFLNCATDFAARLSRLLYARCCHAGSSRELSR